MRCRECGEKCEKKDIYCGNCGVKLESKKNFKFNKLFNSKNKKRIELITIVVLILFLSFSSIRFFTSPKRIAQSYLNALFHQNTKKLYHLLNLEGDKTFTTKQVFEQIMKQNSSSVQEYHITDISYGTGKKTAIATVSYKEKDQKDSKIMKIPLKKKNQKTFFFFDDWEVSSLETGGLIVSNFKVIVPKGSTVTYAGVPVEKKYLNQSESNSTDTYILKQVFAAKTDIVVELENGYKIEDTLTPGAYRNRYIADITLDTISKEEQQKIENIIESDLKTIYQGAIKDLPFSEIKSNLSIEKTKEEQLETVYNEFVGSLKKAYSKLTMIEFTNLMLSEIHLDEDGYLNFKFKANYHYTISYTDFLGGEKTHESSSYSYMNMSYNVKDETYHIVNATSLEDYFSRY